MKKKLIFLDFTSLLDVIMIILFFFIIFSKIETDEYRQGLEDQQNQIVAQQAQYQQELEARESEIQIKEDKAKEALADASKEKENADIMLSEANVAKERSGENVEALAEFNENKNLKLNLIMDPNGESWSISVLVSDETIGVIQKGSIPELTKALKTIFEDKGYTKDDTILIELFYNATEIGTNKAYNEIDGMLKQIRNDYNHCFYSETDLSALLERG